MFITQLTLKNFRCFTEVSIPFWDSSNPEQPSKTIVFIGNNGAGKTAILDALKINLSWLVARINREKGSGFAIADIDIQNGEIYSNIAIQLQHAEKQYSWQLSKTLKGRIKKSDSQLNEVSQLANCFREQLTQHVEQTSFPLIVYYPIERGVMNIPLEINARHSFGQIDGYENSLRGIDFERFFEWFRDREDAENQAKVQDLQPRVEKFAESFKGKGDDFVSALLVYMEKIHSSIQNPQLSAVRSAIKTFMTDFENLRIQRKPRLQMLVDKKGKTLDVAQLSQGEKSMMALVGDIARRLAMMNPALDTPLEGYGIVMIDEIDLHLHPNWQRAIVGNLNRTFPNCQFILTTHSPIIISESPNLLCYTLNDGQLHKLENLYGMDVNQVLLQDMDASIRNTDIQQAFDTLRDTLQDGELATAKILLAELEQKIAIDNLELGKARLLIKRLEAQRAAHH
jgi:predicted ATP-binding protein involved in virulence